MTMAAILIQDRAGSSGLENVPHEAAEVIDFWWLVGPTAWFAKDTEFDRVFRDRFLPLHEAAARGDCDGWAATPYGALALLVLLDQFPRNAFRGTPRMYATDERARRLAAGAIDAEFLHEVHPTWRVFFTLPFAHSESLADQDRSVALAGETGGPSLERAEHHRDIIRRFGRFPHRNPILGRAMRPEEQCFLDEGGFAG
ncbi:hypothetical protein GCM10007880_18300 [Mesorhizobium amorphae]|uniref:Transmembrane protein n=2 Tax=Mesorhizobium amorphae TaxID=71433 RepID=G6Y299_9HYPH|nr:hypothetical protein A6B35_27730 [Mesorhizobium amorphae CCNWGS0123]EHH14082.1 hypothetical protein MEA186_00185 [Mesorhizobium amorphae CCNWGS0123]GLR41314.1 hypothetical protein GCM10007880_18300 [Mesorhizobium amorphae]